MVRIGILGCGRIGQVHILSILKIPNVKLVAIGDSLPSVAEACSEKYNVPIREVDEIIEATDIDAIIIATSSATHYDFIHRIAKTGKAIFCEKPIDLSTDRVKECATLLHEYRTPFMTAFNQRFDPHFATLEQKIAAGEIGDVETIIITKRDPAPPPLSYLQSSGGIFSDMMIHDLDLARFLLKENPVQVYAVGSCLIDPTIKDVGDVDTAAVTLVTPRGRICQITNSRRTTYGYDQRIEVHGSKGMLRVGNVHDSLVEHATAAGFTMPVAKPFFLERFGMAYLAEMEHFIHCLSNGCEPSPTIADGLAAQLLADAATLSLSSGKPVRIDYEMNKVEI